MKRVAILSAGPSLTKTWPLADRSKYSCVVAVNHAACTYSHDWTCFGDFIMLRERPGIPAMIPPRIGYCIPKPVHQRVKEGVFDTRHISYSSLLCERQCFLWGDLRSWNVFVSYSSVAAIGFSLFKLKPDAIDVYGHDMSSQSGHMTEVVYPSKRWQREGEEIKGIINAYNEAGIPINFIRTAKGNDD